MYVHMYISSTMVRMQVHTYLFVNGFCMALWSMRVVGIEGKEYEAYLLPNAVQCKNSTLMAYKVRELMHASSVVLS